MFVFQKYENTSATKQILHCKFNLIQALQHSRPRKALKIKHKKALRLTPSPQNIWNFCHHAPFSSLSLSLHPYTFIADFKHCTLAYQHLSSNAVLELVHLLSAQRKHVFCHGLKHYCFSFVLLDVTLPLVLIVLLQPGNQIGLFLWSIAQADKQREREREKQREGERWVAGREEDREVWTQN